MTEKLTLFGTPGGWKIIDSILSDGENGLPLSKAVGELLSTAEKYRICGDVYKGFIAWLLIQDENPYSLSCEMGKEESGGLHRFALLDCEQIFEAFFVDMSAVCGDGLRGFAYTNDCAADCRREIGELCSGLAKQLDKARDAEEFLSILTGFYTTHGAGALGMNRAFHIDLSDGLRLIPVSDFERCSLSDMWGYERQKQLIADNTEAFLAGRAANNVLLYGDSGTGKSTCIKALLNEYGGIGLRMIEIYKHQFSCLPALIRLLRERRYKFIIYMDDLSFEDFEIEYKFLKAVIEGGLEKKPDNVLIYATSNRRHLIRESFSDRDSNDDIHKNDTVQEKLSLADRFGLTVGFSKPLQKEYFEIVKHLAKMRGMKLTEEELRTDAAAWGLSHGGVSGRVARQYIDHLQSKADPDGVNESPSSPH